MPPPLRQIKDKSEDCQNAGWSAMGVGQWGLLTMENRCAYFGNDEQVL